MSFFASETFEFELRVAEINEKPHFNTGGFKVVYYLGMMLRVKRFHGFEFYEYLSFD